MRKGVAFLVILLGFVSLAQRAECCSGYLVTAGEACGEISLPPAVRATAPRTQSVQHLQAGQASWLASAVRVWLAGLSNLGAPAPHGLAAARGSDASNPLPPPDADTLKQHVDNPGQTAMK